MEKLTKVELPNNNQKRTITISSIDLPQLYVSLHTFILQTLPDSCDTGLANLLFMMRSLFLIPQRADEPQGTKNAIQGEKLTTVKRFSRFLDNPIVTYSPAGYCIPPRVAELIARIPIGRLPYSLTKGFVVPVR